MKWLAWMFGRQCPDTTFYGVNRDGRLALDLAGLLASGRMNNQLRLARQLKRKMRAA